MGTKLMPGCGSFLLIRHLPAAARTRLYPDGRTSAPEHGEQASHRGRSAISARRPSGFDAWFCSFCAENNIEHGINPSGVASPEQLRFMVAAGRTAGTRRVPDATFGNWRLFPSAVFRPRAQPVYRGMAPIIRVVRYESGPPEAPRHDQLLPPPFPGCPRSATSCPPASSSGWSPRLSAISTRAIRGSTSACSTTKRSRLLPFAGSSASPGRLPERRGRSS